MEHDDKLSSINPILSLKTQTRKPSLRRDTIPGLQENICESAPYTWRENKSREGADRVCIHLQYHPQHSSEKAISNSEIRRTRSKINTYGSETILPEGQVTLGCERRGRIHTIDFLVVKIPDENPALLSGRDAQALNYLKVYADETANAVEEEIPHKPQPAPPLGKPTKNDILQCYSNVFRPGGGNPLGTPLHIEVDPNVRPVHAQVRRVPVAKLDKVNEELEKLSNEGIIKPVTQHTDWLSNTWLKKSHTGNFEHALIQAKP